MWALLKPHLPGRRGQWGGIAQDIRRSINAVFLGVRTGAPWRDLPPLEYPQRLNIRKEPFVPNEAAVLLSWTAALLSSIEVDEKREILMLDSPEPDPDYRIYISAAAGDGVSFRFSRMDY